MNKPRIVLDAGHGGIDPGAVAAGVQEKNIALSITIYMAQRAKQLGFEVYLTRDSDTALTPNQRTAMIKSTGAGICISNHINSGGGTGAEVIHSLHSDGKLASAVLQNIKDVGMPVRKAFCKESKSQPGKDYYFMHRLTWPTVPETLIIEYGFIDDATDMAKLTDPDMQKQLVEAVLRALCSHLNTPYLPPAIPELQLNWKEQIMMNAVDAGLIEAGKHQPDEPAPKWFVLAVAQNVIKNAKGS